MSKYVDKRLQMFEQDPDLEDRFQLRMGQDELFELRVPLSRD